MHARKSWPGPIHCMVVTISDTRTEATDKSGMLMCDMLKRSGHIVKRKAIIPDEPAAIKEMVKKGCQDPEIDVILTNGGTGIAYRDVTIETVKPMFDKEISGFGEIFRMFSYQEDIGSAAMMSRAVAGVIRHTAVFSTPGSTGAVRLAMEKLILPELGHVVHEIKKDIKRSTSI